MIETLLLGDGIGSSFDAFNHEVLRGEQLRRGIVPHGVRGIRSHRTVREVTETCKYLLIEMLLRCDTNYQSDGRDSVDLKIRQLLIERPRIATTCVGRKNDVVETDELIV